MSSTFEGTPRFQIVRRLGIGGMGAVFEAFDVERQVAVALKVLAVDSPEALVRFKREFRSLQSVHHPNLISLGELFAQGSTWFFTMELVRGVDLLQQVRAAESRFDLARLRAAFHQLALGLAALHRHGHIHRDVKPSNVMVTPDNRVVLLDFGLVREPGDAVDTSPDLVVGTPEYMAPEQAMGGALGPASDWYAVGVLLYEALVGQPPFLGPAVGVMVQKQMADPPPPSSLVRGVPDDLDALCMALLRRDPAARPSESEILKRLYVELRRDDRTWLTLPLQPTAERFIGRRDALDALDGALDDALAGGARLCFITGGWGIGKTALVRELARRLGLDARAPLCWSSRCHERESIPWKAVDMLMDDAGRFLSRLPAADVATLLPDDIELVARTFPVLSRVPAIAERPPGAYDRLEPQARRSLLFRAVRELFRRIARLRPLVLIIEDLQWADADGLALVQALLAPPSDTRLLFVGTMRTEQPFLYAPAELVDGLDAGCISSLHLGTLEAAESIDLVEALWPEAGEASIRRIVTQSGGHPLFARELCLSRGAHPLKLGDALRARIEPLPADARALLQVIAVAESALPQSLVGEIAAVEWADAERAIAHLRAAQLLRTVGLRRTDLVEIAHDQVRRAVADALLPPALRALHQRIAAALEAWPRASVEALAAHWTGAGQRPRALAAVLAGAERAVAALAFDRAAALYDRALGLCQPAARAAIAASAQAVARLAADR